MPSLYVLHHTLCPSLQCIINGELRVQYSSTVQYSTVKYSTKVPITSTTLDPTWPGDLRPAGVPPAGVHGPGEPPDLQQD